MIWKDSQLNTTVMRIDDIKNIWHQNAKIINIYIKLNVKKRR